MKRDNHYISQFYLRQWADNENRLWAYSLLVPNENIPIWQHASVKRGIGWRRDLYTGVINDTETDEIENWYDNDIEGPASNVIRKISDGDSIGDTELRQLIRFVAAQHVRTPAAYFRLKNVFENNISTRISKRALELKNTLVPNYAQDKELDGPKIPLPMKITVDNEESENDRIKVNIETGYTRNMWHIINQRLLNSTYNNLLDHEWHIIKTPPGVKLYTNDDPVAFVNFYGGGKYDFNGGWKRNSGNAFFPITPNHFLFTEMGTRFSDKDINDMLYRLVYWMQRITIENAFRSIYSISKNPSITDCRTRFVSEEVFSNEKALWEGWNSKQVSFEQEFKDLQQ